MPQRLLSATAKSRTPSLRGSFAFLRRAAPFPLLFGNSQSRKTRPSTLRPTDLPKGFSTLGISQVLSHHSYGLTVALTLGGRSPRALDMPCSGSRWRPSVMWQRLQLLGCRLPIALSFFISVFFSASVFFLYIIYDQGDEVIREPLGANCAKGLRCAGVLRCWLPQQLAALPPSIFSHLQHLNQPTFHPCYYLELLPLEPKSAGHLISCNSTLDGTPLLSFIELPPGVCLLSSPQHSSAQTQRQRKRFNAAVQSPPKSSQTRRTFL